MRDGRHALLRDTRGLSTVEYLILAVVQLNTQRQFRCAHGNRQGITSRHKAEDVDVIDRVNVGMDRVAVFA